MSKLIIRNYDENLMYPVTCDSHANLNDALNIWIKFSSYLKPEELSFMKKIKDKELKESDMDKYYKIKKQIEISKLLLKYKNKECTKKEHDKVVKFMNNISLTDFISSRLTTKQKNKSLKFISSLTFEELNKYIESNQEKYDSLNIYEAYTLFMAKEKQYNIIQKELTEKIMYERLEKATNLRKSLIRDFGC